MGGKKIKKAYAPNLNLNNKFLFFFLFCLSLFLLLLRFFSSHLLLNNNTTPDQDPTNCLQHQLQDDDQDPADQVLLIYNGPIQSTPPPPPPPPKPQLMVLVDEVLQLLKERGNTKIGLVNFSEREREAWEELGTDQISLISFDPVKEEVRWEDLFPEWINEERWPLPRCPEIPMPAFEEYGELDMVVARVPSESTEKTNNKGVRDVMRLQVNLVVANLIAKNGRRRKDHDDFGDAGGGRPVYAVFVGSREPMWEIFRCDDLLRHEGDFWVYKPDLKRLKGVVETPVGTCRLAIPYVKQVDGRIRYLFSKLGNATDHPREAYVTILHSSEAYVCGAIALAQSIIILTKSTKDLVLLADKSITKRSKRALIAAGWKIKHIERIQSPYAVKDAYNEWNYSKLRMWQLTEYDKIIFIDSDLIVIKNMDSFFANSQLSAVGNDNVLFNSGVMLIEPSQCMFEKLMQKRFTLPSYNGGDQGFLNEAFTWWHRWPKTLNYLKIFDQENETERRIPESVYAIHYLGLKPWTCYRDYDCNWDVLDHHLYASDLAHKRWWQVYDAMPKRLRGFCGLSRFMDSSLRMQRAWAKKAKLPDGHWKIKLKDPRRLQRSMII